jgi:hypothetical protein
MHCSLYICGYEHPASTPMSFHSVHNPRPSDKSSTLTLKPWILKDTRTQHEPMSNQHRPPRQATCYTLHLNKMVTRILSGFESVRPMAARIRRRFVCMTADHSLHLQAPQLDCAISMMKILVPEIQVAHPLVRSSPSRRRTSPIPSSMIPYMVARSVHVGIHIFSQPTTRRSIDSVRIRKRLPTIDDSENIYFISTPS